MSQPSTPFNDTPDALFIPTTELQQHLLVPPPVGLPRSSGQDNPDIVLNAGEILDGFDFEATLDNTQPVPGGSSNLPLLSTPDPISYSFDQQHTVYAAPIPHSPHPYPLELQQTLRSIDSQNCSTYDKYSLPILTHTKTNLHRSKPPPQPYTRRESLGHGNVGQISAALPNPIFARPQVRRSRSTLQEDRNRSSRSRMQGRCVSQSPGPRAKRSKPISVPHRLPGFPSAGGMMVTPIGTPFDLLQEPASPAGPKNDALLEFDNLPTYTSTLPDHDPVFRHMTHPHELARSRNIIEIGALAVVSWPTLDPQLERATEETTKERVLSKLDDVERHFQGNDGGQQVLAACAMIRETVAHRVSEGTA